MSSLILGAVRLHSQWMRVRFGAILLSSTLVLTANVPALADGLDIGGAMNMGAWSLNATRYQLHRPVCAWSTTLDRFYRVMANTAENSGRFELLGDLGDRVRFDVRWRDIGVSRNWERLIPGLPSTQSYQFASRADCPGNDTQLQVRLSKKDADRAPGGLYSGILTIILVAE